MDKQTKRTLQQGDAFAQTTEHGLEWAEKNQESTILIGVLTLFGIALIVGMVIWHNHRSAAANAAFGAAMQTYNTPVASPTRPLQPGEKSFPDSKTRALKANAEFVAVANQYGSEQDGKVARYFAGLTYLEAGQNQPAEATFKTVEGYWNGSLSALGKLGLAQLYRAEGHDDQAAALYKQLSDGHASTVPPGMAQIQLAEMYAAEGKTEQARIIYAQLKDQDKDKAGKEGPVGALAAQKLNPPPAAAAQPQM